MVLFPPGEVLPSDFFRGGGGGEGLPHGIIPPGEVLLWDFFRGKACHKVFLHGERLPYGIIFGGQSAMVFVPLSRNVCVWGGEIYHRGGSFTIIMVLFLPWGSSPCDFFRG